MPKQSPHGVDLQDLHTHFCRHVATQQSGKMPVETFATPTGVTHVYVGGIPFCLRVTGDVSPGYTFLPNALFLRGA